MVAVIRLSTSEIIERFRKAYGSTYDYSKVIYLNQQTKVEIICPTHGSFQCLPGNHTKGKAPCPSCPKKPANRPYNMTTEKFVARAMEQLPDYDYSRVVYKSAKNKVEIICPKHGSFFVLPHSILGGHECWHCSIATRSGTRETNGNSVPSSKRTGYKAYKVLVSNVTWSSYKYHKDKINPFNLPRGLTDYHIDHIYSVVEGFKNGLPPEAIGHWSNLQMLTSKENRTKYIRCGKTPDQLLADLESRDPDVKCKDWFRDFQQSLSRG